MLHLCGLVTWPRPLLPPASCFVGLDWKASLNICLFSAGVSEACCWCWCWSASWRYSYRSIVHQKVKKKAKTWTWNFWDSGKRCWVLLPVCLDGVSNPACVLVLHNKRPCCSHSCSLQWCSCSARLQDSLMERGSGLHRSFNDHLAVVRQHPRARNTSYIHVSQCVWCVKRCRVTSSGRRPEIFIWAISSVGMKPPPYICQTSAESEDHFLLKPLWISVIPGQLWTGRRRGGFSSAAASQISPTSEEFLQTFDHR